MDNTYLSDLDRYRKLLATADSDEDLSHIGRLIEYLGQRMIDTGDKAQGERQSA